MNKDEIIDIIKKSFNLIDECKETVMNGYNYNWKSIDFADKDHTYRIFYHGYGYAEDFIPLYIYFSNPHYSGKDNVGNIKEYLWKIQLKDVLNEKET